MYTVCHTHITCIPVVVLPAASRRWPLWLQYTSGAYSPYIGIYRVYRVSVIYHVRTIIPHMVMYVYPMQALESYDTASI